MQIRRFKMISQLIGWYGQMLPTVATLIVVEAVWGLVISSFRGR